MTTRKHQNSILVLATLGVYLGLVLVGATPQVMAQAAMTKQFNVKDEIEVKDDLDNKPDHSESERVDHLLENIESAFSKLIKNLQNCKQLPSSYGYDGNFIGNDCGFSVAKGLGTTTSSDRPSELSRAASAIIDSFDESLLNKLSSGNNKSYISFDLSGRGLKLTLILEQHTQQGSAALADLLNGHIKSKAIRSTNFLPQNLYENSQASTLGNQVFIVSRLPRGSLDTLLASDAK